MWSVRCHCVGFIHSAVPGFNSISNFTQYTSRLDWHLVHSPARAVCQGRGCGGLDEGVARGEPAEQGEVLFQG